jgi:hypothetical protein
MHLATRLDRYAKSRILSGLLRAVDRGNYRENRCHIANSSAAARSAAARDRRDTNVGVAATLNLPLAVPIA